MVFGCKIFMYFVLVVYGSRGNSNWDGGMILFLVCFFLLFLGLLVFSLFSFRGFVGYTVRFVGGFF